MCNEIRKSLGRITIHYSLYSLHLAAALLLVAAVELEPHGPVVSEHAEVIPAAQRHPLAAPDQAGPRAAVQPEIQDTRCSITINNGIKSR